LLLAHPRSFGATIQPLLKVDPLYFFTRRNFRGATPARLKPRAGWPLCTSRARLANAPRRGPPVIPERRPPDPAPRVGSVGVS
jgi:hypothetical protein